MIRITQNVAIDESAIDVTFTRSSGPGGQKVNRAATAVQLRFDVGDASLPEDVRQRLTELAGGRMTKDGELIIEASNHRSQARNRQEALDRLVDLIRQAAEKPKRRRRTRRTAASKRRRLENKRRHSEKKRRRRFTPPPEAHR
jgi:ribosome-associated protein